MLGGSRETWVSLGARSSQHLTLAGGPCANTAQICVSRPGLSELQPCSYLPSASLHAFPVVGPLSPRFYFGKGAPWWRHWGPRPGVRSGSCAEVALGLALSQFPLGADAVCLMPQPGSRPLLPRPRGLSSASEGSLAGLLPSVTWTVQLPVALVARPPCL